MEQKQNEVLIDCAWLETEKLQFKLLVMATVLALNKRAFLGTIEDVIDYLGIAINDTNKTKVRKAISSLVKQGFVIQVKDKTNIIIALSFGARNNSKVISIQRAWLEIIQNYKQQYQSSVAWETVLRVFIYLLGNCGKGTLTQAQIASDLNVSSETVRKAVNVLCNISFGDLILEKEVLRDSMNIDGFIFHRCLGTQYSIMQKFE